jgi:hypothetical protein
MSLYLNKNEINFYNTVYTPVGVWSPSMGIFTLIIIYKNRKYSYIFLWNKLIKRNSVFLEYGKSEDDMQSRCLFTNTMS